VSLAVVDVSAIGWPYYMQAHTSGERPPGPVVTTRTGLQGIAALPPVPPGTYDIVVRAVGFYEEVVHDRVVSAGRLNRLDVRLRPRAVGQEESPLIRMFTGERCSDLFKRTKSRLAAENIQVSESPLEHGSYWLLVPVDDLARARATLRKDRDVAERIEESIEYLQVVERLQEGSDRDAPP